ncbi:MAG: hypothetical protein R2784_19820 [Saprospiraceae bacterium]
MKRKLLMLFGAMCLVFATVNAQITNSIVYDFRDGSIIAAGQSPDGNLSLYGNYSHHGTQYGRI